MHEHKTSNFIRDSYSYAPRGMRKPEAARYMGISMTKFNQMVNDGRAPKPRKIDGAIIWDRVELDIAFSDLPYKKPENILDTTGWRSG